MARELCDYLSITSADARGQWLELLAREPASDGKRQVDFIPVETLMSLAASLRVTHRHYGGTTAAQAAEPVPSLARLFSRPNSSVLAKMANLDGSRRNGAKHEIEVAERLLTAPGALAGMYLILLAAAREVGIGPDRLPDFLELEDAHTNLVLLGQEEFVDVDLQEALKRRASEVAVGAVRLGGCHHGAPSYRVSSSGAAPLRRRGSEQSWPSVCLLWASC